jgi:hypothetical protein
MATESPINPVQITVREDTVIGQPQARANEPHDGTTRVTEIVAITDRHILDPNDPLAVQVPEGVGASTADHKSPLGEALKVGTAEAQFRAAEEEAKKSPKK